MSCTNGPNNSPYPLMYLDVKDWSWLRHVASDTATNKVPSLKLEAWVRAATSLPQTIGQASRTASSAGRTRNNSCMICRKPVRTASMESSPQEKMILAPAPSRLAIATVGLDHERHKRLNSLLVIQVGVAELLEHE